MGTSWWIGGLAVVAVVVLVVVALTRDPVTLDADTPEGTVQIYLQAVNDEDYQRAFDLIDPIVTDGCTPADIAAARFEDSFTAVLVSSETFDNTASVEVDLGFGATPGPFDPGRSGYSEYFELTHSNDDWLISSDPWPYFTWRCDQQ